MTQLKPHKVTTAKGPILWYLKKCGFKGWASFWSTIYVLPGHENNERLLRHEGRNVVPS